MRLSRTVGKNVERLRNQAPSQSRAELVEKLNRNGTSLVKWTPSKLANVEHQKGVDRAISIDEIYDLCRALDVTEYQLTVPHEEPGWSREFQFTLYGHEFEGDDWMTRARDRQDLVSRLRWHPEVVNHTMPFWLEADAFRDLRDSMEDEVETQYRPKLQRDERDAQSAFIEDQRKIVELKVTKWNSEGRAVPDDATVGKWIAAAQKKQLLAMQSYRPSFLGPVKPPREGPMLIEALPPDDEGDS